MHPAIARRLWLVGEPVHAVVYFSPVAADRWSGSRLPRVLAGVLRHPGRALRAGRTGRGHRQLLQLRSPHGRPGPAVGLGDGRARRRPPRSPGRGHCRPARRARSDGRRASGRRGRGSGPAGHRGRRSGRPPALRRQHRAGRGPRSRWRRCGTGSPWCGSTGATATTPPCWRRGSTGARPTSSPPPWAGHRAPSPNRPGAGMTTPGTRPPKAWPGGARRRRRHGHACRPRSACRGRGHHRCPGPDAMDAPLPRGPRVARDGPGPPRRPHRRGPA